MPRPRKLRRVVGLPAVTVFKPQGVPLTELSGVVLSVDGLEALRLADLEGFDHDAAARAMSISRPTFTRLLAQARQITAMALVQGLALRIEGGDYELANGPQIDPLQPCRRRQRRIGCIRSSPFPPSEDS